MSLTSAQATLESKYPSSQITVDNNTLTANLPQLSIPDESTPLIAINSPVLSLTEDPAKSGQPHQISGSLKGTISLGNNAVTLPIVVQFPTGASGWLIESSLTNVITLKLTDLAELAGGQDFVSALPEQLRTMPGFTLSDMQVMYDPVTKRVLYVSTTIDSTNTWEILPNAFAVDELKLRLNVTEPLVSTSRSIDMQFEGIFEIEGQPVTLIVTGPDAMDEWRLSIIPDVSLTLAKLAEHLQEPSLVDQLPDGKASSAQIKFDYLNIGFNMQSKKLSSVGFMVSEEGKWPIVSNKIALDKAQLNLDASNPTDAANRSINGGASATFTVAGVDVNLAAYYSSNVG